MSTHTIWYRCLTNSEESYHELQTTQYDCDRWMAEKIADDYHSNHDGWEASWPLEFSLHETEGGPEVARFVVIREFEPVFYASAIAKVEGRT